MTIYKSLLSFCPSSRRLRLQPNAISISQSSIESVLYDFSSSEAGRRVSLAQ
jgi:hypothetical protein